MPLFGKIVVIKRDGTEGTHFPLTANSCLFGRKKECDIRVQLPQVSKEHCRIEVNENKEAILINLNPANPTKLNGNSVHESALLQNGDIVTVVERSFRFEYPPRLLPKKRHSRCREKETLQVLHVNQVGEEELLYPCNSEYKSPQISVKKREYEGQCSNGSNKHTTQERASEQCVTPESLHRRCRSNKKNETSPFGKLYELMKKETDTQTSQEDANDKTPVQQRAGYSCMKDDILLKSASKVSTAVAVGPTIQSSNTLDKVEQPSDTENQEIHLMFNPIEGHSSRRSTASVQTYATNEISENEAANLPDIQENELEESDAIARIFNDTNSFDSAESVLSASKSKGERLQFYFKPCATENSTSESNVLQIELDSVLGLKSATDISDEIEMGSMHVNTKEHEPSALMKNKYLEIKTSNMGIPQSILKEVDEIYTSEPRNDGNFAIVSHGLCHSNGKSPRRSIKQSKDFSDGTSNQLSEENTVKKWSQEDVVNCFSSFSSMSHQQSSGVKNKLSGLSNVAESGHESNVQIPIVRETVSEMIVSSQADAKQEFDVKKSPRKRKSGELNLLTQTSGKRKRVSFGGHLSPELFDKRLPPNSPLRRGATPRRLSLPFGNSPRAVLKKNTGSRLSVIKSLSERAKHEKKAMSPPAHISLSSASSPPTVASPPCLFLSPVNSPPAQRSVSPMVLPHRQRRFSVSHVNIPSLSSDEKAAEVGEICVNNVQTPELTEQESQTALSIRRSKRASQKITLHGRNTAMNSLHSQRRSGASEANLIVAKSWAEVVKRGVPKSQLRTTTKCGNKGRSTKKIATKPPKNNSFLLRTPTRKVRGHFTTGHANSPAPIVIGKAHTRKLNVAVQVPKVMLKYPSKQHCDVNESFTGMTEMFNTPLNWKKSSRLSAADMTNIPLPAHEEVSEIHTPEKSGKMAISPLNVSDQHGRSNQVSPLKDMCQISTVMQDALEMLPRRTNVREDSLLAETVNETTAVGAEDEKTSPQQKLEPVEALSGVKRLLRTPKLKLEPVEALSGVKRLLRTPKLKSEPVEALSGVKRLLRTPKLKSEPVEALSGVKRLLRTPKLKSEPVEALSGVKQLLRTPALKSEPVEALPGVKRLLRTESDMKHTGGEIDSAKLLKTQEELSEKLTGNISKKTQKPRDQPKGNTSVNRVMKAPKEKLQLVDDLEGIQRLLRTPKQRVEPVEDMVGISRILKTPKQKFMPVDDYLGLQKLMAESKQSCSSPEIDYTGIKEMLDTEDELKVKFMEDNEPPMNFRIDIESREKVPENKSSQQQTRMEASFERKSSSSVLRDNSKNDSLFQELNQVAHSSFNGLKASSDTESIETVLVPESYQQNAITLQDVAQTASVKEPSETQRSPGKIDVQMLEPLASVRRSRRGNVDKHSCTEGHTVKKTQRHTRNNSGAKSVNCVQTNENADQNTDDTSPAQESESDIPAVEPETGKRSSRGKSKNHFTEKNEKMGSDNIRDTQELMETSQETSIKIQLSVSRQKVAGKRNKQAKESFYLEENAACQENSQLSTKTCIRTRNGNELKIECIKINSQEKTESQDLEPTEDDCTGYCLRKRNTRRGNIIQMQPNMETLNTIVDEDKHGGLEYTAPTVCKMKALGNNPIDIKENARGRGKERKVHFLLDKNNSIVLEEKCVCGDEAGTCEKAKIFFERSTFSAKDSTSRRRRKEVAAVSSQPISTEYDSKETADTVQNIVKENQSHSVNNPKRRKVVKEVPPRRGRSKQAISHKELTVHDCKERADIEVQNIVKENQFKRRGGKKVVPVLQASLPSESIVIIKEDPSPDCYSIVQGKYLQEIQNKTHPHGALIMPLENIQSHAAKNPKRQKVVKEDPPRRGRSKQAISHKELTVHDCKETADIEVQNIVKENQFKRRGGKKVVPVLQASLPSESIAVTKEDPSLDCYSIVQGKYLQEMQNEKHPNGALIMPLENIQSHAVNNPKRRKVVKEDPPRRGRSKQAISHEVPIEYDSKKAADTEVQNIKENQFKRSRGKKSVPVFQVSSALENIAVVEKDPSPGNYSFAQEKHLQDMQNGENSNDAQIMPLENIQTAAMNNQKRKKVAKEEPLRRGRSKQATSYEMPTEYKSKEAADIDHQNMVTKMIQSQRSRREKIVPASQVPVSPFTNDCLALSPSLKDKSVQEQLSKALKTVVCANENSSRRYRRKIEVTRVASSVFVCKKPKLLSNGNQEEIPTDLKGVVQENSFKSDRRKRVLSTAKNGQPENDSKVTTPIQDSFGKENQSKRSRGEKVVLACQLRSSSFKLGVALSLSSTEKHTTSAIQSTFTDNSAIEKENLVNSGKRNTKIVPCFTAARIKGKVPKEEDFQKKQNVDLEKTALSNEKLYRRGRRAATVPEATKEKCGLSAGGDVITEDEKVIPENTVSDATDNSESKGKKGKGLPKNTDLRPSSNDGQSSNSQLSTPQAKRGRRKQVTINPETNATTSDIKRSFPEKSTKAIAEKTDITRVQKRKQKMKEEHITDRINPVAEMEKKARASRRIRKQVL